MVNLPTMSAIILSFLCDFPFCCAGHYRLRPASIFNWKCRHPTKHFKSFRGFLLQSRSRAHPTRSPQRTRRTQRKIRTKITTAEIAEKRKGSREKSDWVGGSNLRQGKIFAGKQDFPG